MNIIPVRLNRTLDIRGWLAMAVTVVSCLHQTATAAQVPVALGSAATFGVLAATTITRTGVSIIYGDLGLNPGATLTGAPTVYGLIHLNDRRSAQAQTDLAIDYNDAAGRTSQAQPVTGDLGGQNLAPGLYNSGAALAITAGNLTLDGHGDINAVWIFQMGTTLTTAPGSRVILAGGARAAKIFWQVGTTATLGTASIFKGIILASQSITITTGAMLDGEALAENGTLTLDNNIIGEPPAPSFGPVSVAPDGSVSLIITNAPLLTLILQNSSDLMNWTTLTTLMSGASPCGYTDATASAQARRFYRALYS